MKKWSLNLIHKCHKYTTNDTIRAPTVDVGYVPNVKYLAHIPHQTQFMPIYQMWYMLKFFQLATVKSQIYQCTDRMWYIGLLFFISYSTLISFHFSFSPPPPSPSPLSHSFSSSLFPVAPSPSAHHQFRFYHHWSNHHWSNHINPIFFSPFGSLCPLFYRHRSGSESPFSLWLLANLKGMFVLPPKIPAAHWSRRNF